MKKRPKTPHETPIDDGGKLIEDLQRQFESLRTWQSAESAKLKQREEKIDTRSQALDALATGVEADRVAQDQSRLTLQQAREAFQTERQAFALEQEKLSQELARVNDLQSRAQLERTELKAARADLDGEWSSLRRIRTATETLASELDSERQRIQHTTGTTLKLRKAA